VVIGDLDRIDVLQGQDAAGGVRPDHLGHPHTGTMAEIIGKYLNVSGLGQVIDLFT
jgi:hypothetical protein